MPAPARTPPRPTNAPPPREARKFTTSSGAKERGQRIVIYGEGGIGKSTLASLAPTPLFLDLESGTDALDVARVEGIDDWTDLIAALREPSLWKSVETIVIDSGTAAIELATAHTLANVPHEKGHTCKSIEDYGYGKGYRHLYETFVRLLGDLDRHIVEGRHVALVCHDLTETTPNPEGEDYLRFEPNLLQTGKTGRVRDRVKAWCDHLIFLKYDIDVNREGKAKGSGTRTIWPQAQATFWAKSRTLREPIPFAHDADDTFWQHLLAKETT